MNPLESIIKQFIKQSGKLFSLPDIYQQLDQLLKSKHVSIADISFLISTDAALTAQILKLANSPAFSFKAQINNIDRAISLIGTNELKNLVLLEVIIKNFKTQSNATIDAESFWRRSSYQAIIAKKLALHIKHTDPDRIFVCGILSRIGELICADIEPVKVQQLNTEISTLHLNPVSEAVIEQKIWGFNYNQLSAQLLKHWEIPQNISYPITSYSFPLEVDFCDLEQYKIDSFILHCASVYSFLLNLNESEVLVASDLLSYTNPKIAQQLKLDDDFIEQLLFDIEMDALALLSVIFPDSLSIY